MREIFVEGTSEDEERLTRHYKNSTLYNKTVGNIYTGSLYLSLISLLEQDETLKPGDRIGLFSYGSGAVGEFFTGILQPEYKEALAEAEHAKLFAEREEVSIEEYEEIFSEVLPVDGSNLQLTIENDPAMICVAGIEEHKRIYVNKNR